MINKKDFDFFIGFLPITVKNNEKNEYIQTKEFRGFITGLFDKNEYKKPKKVPFLSSKWGKCPNCGHTIKLQFYCPFCGQRIKKRQYMWIDEVLMNSNQGVN